MQPNRLYGALDFTYVLLEQYKALALKEDEVAVILMIDHLLGQGNRMITSDALALKMALPTKEIEKILADLLKRGLVEYVPGGKGLKTSLEPLRKRVYEDFSRRMEKEEATMGSAEKAEEIKAAGSFLEDKLNRSLTPLEQSTLQDWFALGYSLAEIREAVLDTLVKGTRSFKAFEKSLKANRRKRDIEKEGTTAVGENYDKDIEETFALARKLFGDN